MNRPRPPSLVIPLDDAETSQRVEYGPIPELWSIPYLHYLILLGDDMFFARHDNAALDNYLSVFINHLSNAELIEIAKTKFINASEKIKKECGIRFIKDFFDEFEENVNLTQKGYFKIMNTKARFIEMKLATLVKEDELLPMIKRMRSNICYYSPSVSVEYISESDSDYDGLFVAKKPKTLIRKLSYKYYDY